MRCTEIIVSTRDGEFSFLEFPGGARPSVKTIGKVKRWKLTKLGW
jgi:hypothetical protein